MAEYTPDFRVSFFMNDDNNREIGFLECNIVESCTITWGRSKLLEAPDNRRLSMTIVGLKATLNSIFDRAFFSHVEVYAKLPGMTNRQIIFRGEVTDATLIESDKAAQWRLKIVADEALTRSKLGKMTKQFRGHINGPQDLISQLGIEIVNPPNKATYYDLPPDGKGRPGFGGTYTFSAVDATKMIGETQLLSYCALSPELDRMALTIWKREVSQSVALDACLTGGSREIVADRSVRTNLKVNAGSVFPGTTDEYDYKPLVDKKTTYWQTSNPPAHDRAVNPYRRNTIDPNEKIVTLFSENAEGVSAFWLMNQQRLAPAQITLRASKLPSFPRIKANNTDESIFVPWELDFAFVIKGNFLQRQYLLENCDSLHPIGGTLTWTDDDLIADLTCLYVKAPDQPLQWSQANYKWNEYTISYEKVR